jgi:hypothetical protein
VTDPRDADAALLEKSGRAAMAAELARPRRRQVDTLQEMMGPPAPVWLNTDGSKKPDGICVVYAGPNRCRATARMWVWIGCTVGEHLDRSATCRKHAEDIERGGHTYSCKRCWDAVREVSMAKVIKIEDIDDDDNDAPAAPGQSPDLLP